MNLIYRPKGRAGEYANLACNVYRGCDHRCVYCYAPSTTRRSSAEFATPTIRAGNFLAKLRREAAKYQTAGITEQVLLSFTCDPYQHFDTHKKITRQAIRILHQHGLAIQILTKGGPRALRDLDLFTPADAFATTLTLLDDNQSLKWEPAAAFPGERIETIKTFHQAGISTWVSLEPVLDPAASLEIIRRTHTFVDLYKVGKLNYHPLAQTIDWVQFARDVVGLLESLGQEHYIKRDLACYLEAT
jgi:DNA repair photolyase